MPREHYLPPSAASLSESMRDLGYSLETAVADLIDNSLTANATEIDVLFQLSESPILVITDNGSGMTEDDLLHAMKHGSSNPKHTRHKNDLGRFGLGLKTSSFSQCRRLTVVSQKGTEICAAEWDLDVINQKDEWCLSVLDGDDIQALPFQHPYQAGTSVIWSNLDRLFEDHQGCKREHIVYEKLDLLDKHLSLVFHRFLAGDVAGYPKLSIRINGHPIQPFDPFFRGFPSTQVLPYEVVALDGHQIKIQPYVLPHHSKLTAKEHDEYESQSNLFADQGAYVYRNGRLMVWGDWFRLFPKSELTKLARVQIDFPNALDEKWTIDIKKSRARPPYAVKERLRQIIPKITENSQRVYKGRGHKMFAQNKELIWEAYQDTEQVRFQLNQDHPLLQACRQGLTYEQHQILSLYLNAVSSGLPIDQIYAKYSDDPCSVQQFSSDENEIKTQLNSLKQMFLDTGRIEVEKFKEIVRSLPMFSKHQKLIDVFIEESLYE